MANEYRKPEEETRSEISATEARQAEPILTKPGRGRWVPIWAAVALVALVVAFFVFAA